MYVYTRVYKPNKKISKNPKHQIVEAHELQPQKKESKYESEKEDEKKYTCINIKAYTPHNSLRFLWKIDYACEAL